MGESPDKYFPTALNYCEWILKTCFLKPFLLFQKGFAYLHTSLHLIFLAGRFGKYSFFPPLIYRWNWGSERWCYIHEAMYVVDRVRLWAFGYWYESAQTFPWWTFTSQLSRLLDPFLPSITLPWCCCPVWPGLHHVKRMPTRSRSRLLPNLFVQVLHVTAII